MWYIFLVVGFVATMFVVELTISEVCQCVVDQVDSEHSQIPQPFFYSHCFAKLATHCPARISLCVVLQVNARVLDYELEAISNGEQVV
jgi:hypothetical protein